MHASIGFSGQSLHHLTGMPSLLPLPGSIIFDSYYNPGCSQRQQGSRCYNPIVKNVAMDITVHINLVTFNMAEREYVICLFIFRLRIEGIADLVCDVSNVKIVTTTDFM